MPEPNLRYCEYCDTRYDPDTNEECPDCLAQQERDRAYWFAQFAREPAPYTREEIEDCYSEPCERNKRDALLERLGL